MSGRVIGQAAEPAHQCAPGVTYREITQEDVERGQAAFPGMPASLVGLSTATPPDRWRYPPGTVWQCECGRLWEAWRPAGADASGQIGRIWWRRVGWFRRWRMRRRAGRRTIYGT